MKLEDQVCSLDLAKNLKELGVKQESLFYWETCADQKRIIYAPSRDENDKHFPAFTVAELGWMLPEHSSSEKNQDGSFNGYYYQNEHQPIYSESEADVRAKMLIYLIENNLMELLR